MAAQKRAAPAATRHPASKVLTSTGAGVRLINGRVIGPTLADPGMDKVVDAAQRRMFPTRQAAIEHFRKRGVLTSTGNLTKAFRD